MTSIEDPVAQNAPIDKNYPMKRITSPHDNDILCGRGGVTHYHPGNSTFRHLVNINKPLYASLEKVHKTKLSKGIVKSIREQTPSGRFLVLQKKTGFWADVGDKKATEKTSQALREGQPNTKDKIDMLSSMLPSDMPSTEKQFDELIRAQKETLIKSRVTTPKPFLSSNSNAIPERGLHRMSGDMELTNSLPQKNERMSLQKIKSESTSSSQMSMFSSTSSIKGMFANIAANNLNLDDADFASMMESGGSYRSKMDIDSSPDLNSKNFKVEKATNSATSKKLSKQSEASDDEWRQIAKLILSEDKKPSELDFRRQYRDNKAKMSDLTASITNLGVSNLTIDTSTSMKSVAKSECSETIAESNREILQKESNEMIDATTRRNSLFSGTTETSGTSNFSGSYDATTRRNSLFSGTTETSGTSNFSGSYDVSIITGLTESLRSMDTGTS